MDVVIGGGLTGMLAAYELGKNDRDVLLIEKDDHLGGLMSSVTRNDYCIEKYYHHIFSHFDNTINLIDELGLKDKLVWQKVDNGFYDEKLYRMNSAVDMLYYKPLGFIDKIRIAKIMLRIKGIKDPTKFDDVPAEDWIIKNAGQRVFEKFFKPLLLSKYGDNRNISAAWFIERMKLRSKRGATGEKLGYLKGGFHIMLKKIEKKLRDFSVEIELSNQIKSAKTQGNRIESVQVDSEVIKVDSMISTINPKSLEKILPQFKAPDLRYQGSLCVLLALDKEVHPYYWTNIIKPELHFGAIIEHTNFMPYTDYHEHLVYLASYPDENSPLWKQKDEQVFSSYFTDLRNLFGVEKKNVLDWWVFKNRESGLVFEIGTARKILPTRTQFENLFVGGMFNSYPERSMDESIRLGRACAKLAMGE